MTGGMMYFPRMLDKIRLHGRGELGEGPVLYWHTYNARPESP